MPPIVFYFPYREIGGVSVLFLRVAGIIKDSRRVIIVDFDDGYMAKNIPDGCEFLSCNKVRDIPVDSIIVVQSCPFWSVNQSSELPLDVRVFYWNLHPDNLSPYIISKNTDNIYLKKLICLTKFISIFRKRKLISLVRYLSEKESIVFMDRENYSKTKTYLGDNFGEVYLPILTAKATLESFSFPAIDDELLCSWVGRLDGFKLPILLHVIKRLGEIKTVRVKLSIVGDGVGRSAIQDALDASENVTGEFLGSMDFGKLDEFLVTQNLLFAMGTSALEGAKLGLPTICLDYSYTLIEGIYKFRFIYEVESHSLGEEISDKHMEHESSFSKKIEELVCEFEDISSLSKKYWVENNCPEMVASRFLYYVDRSHSTVGELVSLRLNVPDIMSFLKYRILN